MLIHQRLDRCGHRGEARRNRDVEHDHAGRDGTGRREPDRDGHLQQIVNLYVLGAVADVDREHLVCLGIDLGPVEPTHHLCDDLAGALG